MCGRHFALNFDLSMALHIAQMPATELRPSNFRMSATSRVPTRKRAAILSVIPPYILLRNTLKRAHILSFLQSTDSSKHKYN